MKLFYFFNDDFGPMLELFLSSIRDGWEIYQIKTDNFHTNKHAGGINGNLLRKLLIDYALSNTDPGEIFTICDIDIYFYKQLIPIINNIFNKPQKILINNSIEYRDLDIVFQKEHRFHGCNMGVMSMKNNIHVINFWNKVYEKSLSNNLWDQPIVNEILYDNLIFKTDDESSYKDLNNVVWHTFDVNVWNWSMKNTRPFIQAGSDIVLHHANCTIKLDSKLSQLNSIYTTLVGETHKNYQNNNLMIFDHAALNSTLEDSIMMPNIIKTEYFQI